jgi:hypothetical protein
MQVFKLTVVPDSAETQDKHAIKSIRDALKGTDLMKEAKEKLEKVSPAESSNSYIYAHHHPFPLDPRPPTLDCQPLPSPSLSLLRCDQFCVAATGQGVRRRRAGRG